MRKATVFVRRMENGFVKLFQCPQYNAIIMIVAAAAIYSLLNWDRLLAYIPIPIARPLLVTIQGYTADIFIVVDIVIVAIYATILAVILTGIATTFSGRKIEERVRMAFLLGKVPKETIWPNLILRKRMKKDGVKVTVLKFYSLGIPKEVWEQHKAVVLANINSHLTEDIQNGGKHQEKGHIIMLYTRPGINPKPQGAPEDPLFM